MRILIEGTPDLALLRLMDGQGRYVGMIDRDPDSDGVLLTLGGMQSGKSPWRVGRFETYDAAYAYTLGLAAELPLSSWYDPNGDAL